MFYYSNQKGHGTLFFYNNVWEDNFSAATFSKYKSFITTNISQILISKTLSGLNRWRKSGAHSQKWILTCFLAASFKMKNIIGINNPPVSWTGVALSGTR